MGKSLKILIIFLAGVLFYPQVLQAGYCVVKNGSDNSDAGSLRHVIEVTYQDGGQDSNCTPPGGTPGDADYFDQVVIFNTSAWTEDGKVEKITFGSNSQKNKKLTFNNSYKDIVIGNWAKEVVESAQTNVDYKENYISKLDSGKDFGMVTLDAQTHFTAGISPFQCANKTQSAFFRNVILLTNGVTKDQLPACIKDAGAFFVCAGELTGNPKINPTGWCDQEDADGDGFSKDEGDCNDDDVNVFPNAFDDPDTAVDEDCDGINDGCKLAVNPESTSVAQNQFKNFDVTITYEGTYDKQAKVDVQGIGIGDNVLTGTLDLSPSTTTGPLAILTTFGTPAQTYDLTFVAKTEYTDASGNNKIYECKASAKLIVEVAGVEAGTCKERVASGQSVADVCKDPNCKNFCDDDKDLHCDSGVECIDGTTPGDCDDADIKKFPGNPEICDGKDNNCDGQIDEDVLKTFYPDVDGDNFGDKKASKQACTAPADHTTNNKDCNDDEVTINPDVKEDCSDGVDNDCDGDTDAADNECQDGGGSCPDGTHPQVYFEDQDGDTFGSVYVQETACTVPAGFVKKGGDCLDTNAKVNPSAKEICDGLDNNCDAVIDHMDNDKDGYVSVCPNDCDDDDAKTNPGVAEICGDGFDQDCDGTDVVCKECTDGDAKTWFIDHDKDGDGNPAVSTKDCEQPEGYVGNDNDCNDNDPTVNSFATEAGGGCEDGVDNDCDGAKDLDEAICQLEPPPPPPGEFDPDFLGGGFSDGCSLNPAASSGSPITYVILFGLLAAPVISRLRKRAANESRNIF